MKLIVRNTRESRHLDIAEVDILDDDGTVVARLRDVDPLPDLVASRIDDAVADVRDAWTSDDEFTGEARIKVGELWLALANALDTLDAELNQR